MLPHLLAWYSWTGIDNPSGIPYGWWSGIGSVLVPMSPATWVLYRKNQCHEPWCWRIGKYEITTVEHVWKVCRKHHPHDDPRPPTQEVART